MNWPGPRCVAGALLVLCAAACSNRPYGSTPALERQKLQDLQASAVPLAVVGGTEAGVERLASVTDNAASVALSLTRTVPGDPEGAFVQSLRVARQNGASFTSVFCLATQTSAQGTIAIRSAAPAGQERVWVATLLVSVLGDKLQAAFDVSGGPAMPLQDPTGSAPLDTRGCPDAITQSLQP